MILEQMKQHPVLKRTDLSEPNFGEVIDPIFDPIGLNVPGPGDHVRVLKKVKKKWLGKCEFIIWTLFEFI